MGLMSRLDMNTCQTNIKTDILLVHCWRPLLGTTDNTRHLESIYQTEQEGALVKHN